MDKTYFGTEAVTNRTQLLNTLLLLEVLDAHLDNGVDVVRGVGVVAGATLCEPAHEVEVGVAVEGERVAVEDVNDQGQVAVGGVLIGDQLAVLPDAEHVGDEQDASVLVCLLGCGHGEVGSVLADLDLLTGRCASANS